MLAFKMLRQQVVVVVVVGGGAPEPPTSWQILYQLKFELSRPDAFYIMFQNDTSALAMAFYFNWWRMDDLENFFVTKMSH